jgi:polyketide biosynthesis enoyl-CoA hydratase PksH
VSAGLTSAIAVGPMPSGVCITLRRPGEKNTITKALLDELHLALDEVEGDDRVKLVTICGSGGFFCTGMDFGELLAAGESRQTRAIEDMQASYMSLLSRISQMGKVFIAEIDGVATAGGLGIVAACDVAVATPGSKFTLSEALWGLMPCMVMPFLIRRVGFQFAYHMTLTTSTVDAESAARFRLVDELSDNLLHARRKLGLRLRRLNLRTIGELKSYFARMCPISEEIKAFAIGETTRLALKPETLAGIGAFVRRGVFPWDSAGDAPPPREGDVAK